MHVVYDIVLTSAPLLLAACGALISEYAGVMAVFADGCINIGAFLCFAVTARTGSLAAGIGCSAVACTGLAYGVSVLTLKLRANPFLTGLALNVFASSCISVLSAVLFGTRGVLVSPAFSFTGGGARVVSAIAAYGLCAAAAVVLRTTKAGLHLRVTGSAPNVLTARGVSPDRWKTASWCAAAAFAAAAGCVLALRLSSFVPNISAGRGWTALAAVFLGGKKLSGTLIAVLVFAGAEYAANNIQNVAAFANVPSSVLLALPYAAALVMIGAGRRAD
ncbi:ABC transporter permease subunit [Treponema brennaborense]|uniref:ABC-type transporter, integral membrane subunit n=1 Tax=Treponema brennaborense (strain DSM 12168 / CIP 105900 / DD5/3) TaxID=906968 RepID=F4LPK5_TREBD|nr:ABC transporter permease [Treponema brennaborense]AEE16016.1 ABC-type transporter, integral membrane subunit [Treponema brennaborense DSM 12168]